MVRFIDGFANGIACGVVLAVLLTAAQLAPLVLR